MTQTMETYERVVAARDVGPAGLYESNYLKANAPDGSAAVWLKHNLLVPAAGAPIPAVAEFWCVVWRVERGFVPRVWKRVLALDDVKLGSDRLEIDAGDVARLVPDRAEGALADDSGEVEWALDIADELPPAHHYPSAWMYEGRFPRTKTLSPSPRARMDGALAVGGERIDVAGWSGYRGHNWGTEHAHSYAHGNCNLWDGDADLFVGGSTAKAVLGAGVTTPWITLLEGVDRGVSFGASSLWQVLKQHGEVAWPRWFAYGGGRRSRVRLEMELEPSHAAGLRYLHPDGRVSYCYNVKDASVDLLVSGERYTSDAGELEFLFPEPVPGIDLHGQASFDEVAAAL